MGRWGRWGEMGGYRYEDGGESGMRMRYGCVERKWCGFLVLAARRRRKNQGRKINEKREGEEEGE